MRYRNLGSTNLKVSVIGFGGIPIQRVSQEKAKDVIARAEELGINYIDTARGYTVSEEYIGEALKGRRDKWIIATKSMARDRESMKRDLETSLRNLKTDYIDLYQLHNVKTQEDFERAFGENGAYRLLETARKEGKIGHIGITSHSADMLEKIIQCTEVETIMYPYSIVETQAEALFKKAHELGIGVIAMKPMAGGAIQDGKLAMKFILGNEYVTTAIPGMAEINEVEQNVSAADDNSPLTVEERLRISRISEELGKEFCRRCGYCAPCPQGIDIPSMFLFEGYKKRYDLEDWALGRYMACEKRAKDCKECGLCEERCPYDLPIRRMLKGVRETFGE